MRARVKTPTHVLWYLLRTQEIRVSLGGNTSKWCHSTALEPDREVQPDSAGGGSDSRGSARETGASAKAIPSLGRGSEPL